MAAERIFDEVDVQELLEQNAAPPFGARNAALILGGVYWGLTPLELCLVSTEDVLAPNGDFYRVWVLPKHASFNGIAREIHTADHTLPFVERYLDLRKGQNWGLSLDLHSPRGLSPSSRYDNGAGWSDLMKVTGIKQKRTLEKKVRTHERELETVLASLFSRVKIP